ncbi:ribose 5-phosphate isomerase B [Collinsella sp. BA40]|uniref:ribose 5-phosphate isomerase B n=1 Tax=Collinsella sp. BA40 TaxID=2560852 RepID=UPI0011C75BCF|nr:ribose 5-phosphate isomerase B [Collinsella sp. BA40]TXF38277.1 ribose 5-phosphate isomerase B [Collinsella sp. BA40]
MRIALGSDHAGFEQKQMLKEYLANELGHEVIDLGPDTDDRVDYPDFGEKVGRCVASGDADRGVCVCGTGIGIAVAADKVAGVRASSITTPEFADLFRRHNDGNVIGLSGRFVDPEVNREIVKVFLTSEFEGGRHAGRVEKIMQLDTTGKVEAADQPGGEPAAC